MSLPLGARTSVRPAGSLPVISLLQFIVGAVGLRLVSIAAWGFFPGTDRLQHVARIVIPLGVLLGLLALNRFLLRRDGFPRGVLGLAWRQAGWFFAGGVLALPLLLLMAGGLWLLVPFHWEVGSLSWTRFGWQLAEYSVGNFAEELMFRGYLLLVLTRHLGLHRALVIVALLFGLFHLPGLAGWAALKMIGTTAVWSFLFASVYVWTGSLWAAVGLHVWGNLLLHQTLGLSDGQSLLRVVLHDPWPSHYDPAFIVTLGLGGAFALLGARLLRATAIQAFERKSRET